MSSSSNTDIINPKDCSYGCSARIYWNTSENAYWEVFSNKKHVCPNRSNKTTITTTNTNNTSVNRPFYYKNKVGGIQRPKMSNSLELLTGPIQDIQKKYEILSDIVSEYNGKVHGSQSHIVGPNNSISLIVYYEVPEGKREEVKQRFNNSIIILQQQRY